VVLRKLDAEPPERAASRSSTTPLRAHRAEGPSWRSEQEDQAVMEAEHPHRGSVAQAGKGTRRTPPPPHHRPDRVAAWSRRGRQSPYFRTPAPAEENGKRSDVLSRRARFVEPGGRLADRRMRIRPRVAPLYATRRGSTRSASAIGWWRARAGAQHGRQRGRRSATW